MEKALLDGKTVDAAWAAELPNEVLAQIRSRFKCIGCDADAYLSKGSWRQAAHFAAKNHAEDCSAAYQGDSGGDTALVQVDTVIISLGGDQTGSSNDYAHTTISQPSRRTSISGAGGVTDTSARRGVSKVLQELLAHPEFATSQKTIVVGKVGTPASEFFVPFLQLGEQHADRLLGVWGTLFAAREGSAVVWLNRGDQKLDIQVPMTIFDELKTIYKFTSAKQLHGAKFLLIGEFNFLLECRVKSAKQIALQVAPASS